MVSIYFAGIDLGSTMTKIAIVNDDEELCATVTYHTGAEHRHMANRVMEEALGDYLKKKNIKEDVERALSGYSGETSQT